MKDLRKGKGRRSHEPEERGCQRDIPSDRPQQDVHDQGKRRVAERFDEERGEAEAEQKLVRSEVRGGGRGIARYNHSRGEPPFAEPAGNDRDEEEDSSKACVRLNLVPWGRGALVVLCRSCI